MGIKSEDSTLTSGGSGAAPSVTQAVRDVLAERRRQIEVEGWTTAHDDQHSRGEMGDAAACYAASVRAFKLEKVSGLDYAPFERPRDLWPWDDQWWKPGDDRRQELVKAGALIVAEIERLDRAALLTDGAALATSQGQAVQNLTDPASPSPKEER